MMTQPLIHPGARRFSFRPSDKLPPFVHLFDEGMEVAKFPYVENTEPPKIFAQFQLNGFWYAMYSGDNTTISLITLPGCERTVRVQLPDDFNIIDIFIPHFRDILAYNK